MKHIVNLIFEAAVLKRLQRTGWQILGDNQESVGEHSYMTAVIGYLLARMISKPKRSIDLEKVLLMSIFHDFHEARTGDVDKISTFYVTRDEGRANDDIFSTTDPEMADTLVEYEKRESPEAKIVYEANIVALLVELKALQEKGNRNVDDWIEGNCKRLRIPEAKQLAKEICSSNTQDWWKDIRKKLHKSFAA